MQSMQELKDCIIDETELTSLIMGGDWNCTQSKKDKIGLHCALEANNLQLHQFMEMFDLVHIQIETLYKNLYR